MDGGWTPRQSPRPPRPRVIPIRDDGSEDWARLETHVRLGIFSPPVVGDALPARSSTRPTRNRHLVEARVPTSLCSLSADGRTYKTTVSRLRPIVWNTLITLVDGEVEVPFRLFQVVRRGDEEWARMRFRHLVGGEVAHELVVVNNEADPRAPAEPEERPITVVRDGVWWVAKFAWSEANVDAVRAAGFRYSPIERWWCSTDPEAARRLGWVDPTSRETPARRPVIRLWRR